VPIRPPRPCTQCHQLGAWDRHGRCPTCESAWQARRNAGRAQRGRYGPRYQANRRRLLASNPPCHWCGTPGATTADHINGDDPDHLVAACLSCNSRRITWG